VSRAEFIRQHLALVLEQYRNLPRPRVAGIVKKPLRERGDEAELYTDRLEARRAGHARVGLAPSLEGRGARRRRTAPRDDSPRKVGTLAVSYIKKPSTGTAGGGRSVSPSCSRRSRSMAIHSAVMGTSWSLFSKGSSMTWPARLTVA